MNKIVFIVLILAGCARQSYWEKSGATGQEFEMDRGQCQAQAFGVTGMNSLQVALVYNGCMRGKGWYQVQR